MFNTGQQKMSLRALNYLLANADLTSSERQNAATALAFIGGLLDGDIILSPWTSEDVKSLVDEDDEAEGIAPVTDEEARLVLKNADDDHDAEVGINWEVLRTHLDAVREEPIKG